jgi:uncharacterized peroxidase-related enzyme
MITLHEIDTAPENSRPTLAAVENANGFVPNVFKALANSPSTLNGFAALLGANDNGTLSPTERQIVQLAASIENGGAYCVAGHTTFAESVGVASETIAAVRDGTPLADARYQALVDFTRTLIHARGHVTDSEIAAFVAAGFGQAQILEVIAGVALKTVTNYVGSVFDLPLDVQFAAQAWAPAGNAGNRAVIAAA